LLMALERLIQSRQNSRRRGEGFYHGLAADFGILE